MLFYFERHHFSHFTLGNLYPVQESFFTFYHSHVYLMKPSGLRSGDRGCRDTAPPLPVMTIIHGEIWRCRLRRVLCWNIRSFVHSPLILLAAAEASFAVECQNKPLKWTSKFEVLPKTDLQSLPQRGYIKAPLAGVLARISMVLHFPKMKVKKVEKSISCKMSFYCSLNHCASS